jgi:hypothetical protein
MSSTLLSVKLGLAGEDLRLPCSAHALLHALLSAWVGHRQQECNYGD